MCCTSSHQSWLLIHGRGYSMLKSKLSRTDRRTFRPRFTWEMLIHIWISPKHWKDASGEKRSLGSDILYVFLCLETQVYVLICGFAKGGGIGQTIPDEERDRISIQSSDKLGTTNFDRFFINIGLKPFKLT